MHENGIIIARQTVDDLVKPVFAQLGQILVYRRVPVYINGPRGLGQGHGQVPERLGQTGRPGGVARPGPLKDEGDRLGSGERAHGNQTPGTGVELGHGRRDKDAQALAVGDQPGQIVKVLDIVEHEQAITLTGVEPRHAPACENFRGSLPAVLVDPHLDGQLGQPRHERLTARSVHPRHQRPPGLFTFAGISCGQLRLAHTPHPTHNNRPTHRPRARIVADGRKAPAVNRTTRIGVADRL